MELITSSTEGRPKCALEDTWDIGETSELMECPWLTDPLVVADILFKEPLAIELLFMGRLVVEPLRMDPLSADGFRYGTY